MTATSRERSTPPCPPPVGAEDLRPGNVVHRRAGRNRSKADVVVYRSDRGTFALKDYGPRPWLVRQTLGRWLVRREVRAYAASAGCPGLPRFLGRQGPFALAVEWIPAKMLAECEAGSVDASRFDRLDEVIRSLHDRGVALADLNYRDILLADAGAVFVIDLAAAWVLGDRPGPVRRRLFERFRAADRFALARLRARFVGEDPTAAIAAADPRALAWHRRARRLKWCWDRLRGAPRLPPVDDHWRFRGPVTEPYNRTLARARVLSVVALIGVLVAAASPSRSAVAAGAGFVIAGEAVRIWAAGHLVKNERLVTSGPYRYVRNPLYLGRLLIFTGLCVMATLPRGANWIVLLGGFGVFFGYYLPRKERVEPARLRAIHAESFERYRRAVPSLLPLRGAWRGGSSERWTLERALRNREHWMVAALVAVVAVLAWKAHAR